MADDNKDKPKRKGGSDKSKGLGRNGLPPPDTTGMKYKRNIPKELDKRRFNFLPNPTETKYDKIDGEQVKALCSIGCTQIEIASVLGVSQPVLDKYLNEFHGMSFREFFKKYADGFKVSLRRLQMKSAEGEYDEELGRYTMFPSVPMQIWLGKQFLDQKDKNETVIDEKKSIPQFEWADAEDVTYQKKLNEDTDEEEDSDEDSDEIN